MELYKVVKYFDTYPKKRMFDCLSEKKAKAAAQKLNTANNSPNVEYLVRLTHIKAAR